MPVARRIANQGLRWQVDAAPLPTYIEDVIVMLLGCLEHSISKQPSFPLRESVAKSSLYCAVLPFREKSRIRRSSRVWHSLLPKM